MAVPASKKELIDDIQVSYGKLRSVISALDYKNTQDDIMPGHVKDTTMSLHNLVSYLLGWAERMLEWDDEYVKTGIVPSFQVSDFGGIAQQFYKKYEDVDFDTLVQKLDKTVESIVAMLESKTNEELYEDVWYTTKSSNKDYSFGRLVQLNTSSPYRNALGRIKKWRKEAI